jgi:polysaccharide export outer membrane protein
LYSISEKLCIFANLISSQKLSIMNKRKIVLFVSVILMAIMTSSCVTSKSVRYLQDMPKEGIPLNETLEATVCPYDELRIRVYSNGGDEDELVRPFNIMGGVNTNTYGYLVDVNGNIEFPILGELHVEGLTRLQLQDAIRTRLQNEGYVNDPLVVVRFMNFRVFFLSSTGGRVINISNERCTFLEALAMAGGLDLYTRRDRIGVMREVNGRRVVHYLDPRSTAIFDDEFFLLQQNDIIFTEINARRYVTEAYSNWSLLLSAVSSVLTAVGLWMSFRNIGNN